MPPTAPATPRPVVVLAAVFGMLAVVGAVVTVEQLSSPSSQEAMPSPVPTAHSSAMATTWSSSRRPP